MSKVMSVIIPVVLCLAVGSCVNWFGLDLSKTDTKASTSAQSEESRMRIADGFQALGMDENGSKCYADRIDAKLDGERLVLAADIVSEAKNKDDVKKGVTSGGADLKTAFFFANMSC